MGPQFQGDAIIISPQIQEFKEPISQKPKISGESPSNPLCPQNSNALKRPLSSLFFKTRLCVKFRSGSCTNGRTCNFAHGSEELRRPPPNWQDLVAKDSGVRDEQMLQKNWICKMFYRGEVCSYGESCSFMHVEHGRRGANMMSKGSASVLESGNNGSESIVVVGSGNGPNQKTVVWKTRICNKWEAMGHCPFGEKCQFAHGHAELAKFRRSLMELDRANVAAALVKPHLQLIKNVSASTTMSSVNHHTRGFLKWEGLHKKRHIYADWIDDIPPRICSTTAKAGT